MASKKTPGADLANMRKRHLHTCPIQDEKCLKTFYGVSTAKYCSNRCRQVAKNRRKRSADQP